MGEFNPMGELKKDGTGWVLFMGPINGDNQGMEEPRLELFPPKPGDVLHPRRGVFRATLAARVAGEHTYFGMLTGQLNRRKVSALPWYPNCNNEQTYEIGSWVKYELVWGEDGAGQRVSLLRWRVDRGVTFRFDVITRKAHPPCYA